MLRAEWRKTWSRPLIIVTFVIICLVQVYYVASNYNANTRKASDLYNELGGVMDEGWSDHVHERFEELWPTPPQTSEDIWNATLEQSLIIHHIHLCGLQIFGPNQVQMGPIVIHGLVHLTKGGAIQIVVGAVDFRAEGLGFTGSKVLEGQKEVIYAIAFHILLTEDADLRFKVKAPVGCTSVIHKFQRRQLRDFLHREGGFAFKADSIGAGLTLAAAEEQGCHHHDHPECFFMFSTFPFVNGYFYFRSTDQEKPPMEVEIISNQRLQFLS